MRDLKFGPYFFWVYGINITSDKIMRTSCISHYSTVY